MIVLDEQAIRAAAQPDLVFDAVRVYRNAERGLPNNHGLVCVLNAHTGEVRAVLDDRGLLTAWRTAAAGALITHALARPDATTVGVFGTGDQAESQASWLAKLRPLSQVLVHGRDERKAAAVCARPAAHGLLARPATARDAAGADIVITTTAATSPVLAAVDVRPGAHVTGVGALDAAVASRVTSALLG